MKHVLKRNILKNSAKIVSTSCLYFTPTLIATIKVEFSYRKTTRIRQMSIGKSIDIESIQYQYSIHF